MVMCARLMYCRMIDLFQITSCVLNQGNCLCSNQFQTNHKSYNILYIIFTAHYDPTFDSTGGQARSGIATAKSRAPQMCRKCNVLRKGHKCPFKGQNDI